MNHAYNQLVERFKEINTLGGVSALLDWDQEVYMPEKGVEARARQLALMAGIRHDRLVCDDVRRWLDEARTDGGDWVGPANLREARRTFDREAKLPKALVERLARETTLAKAAWAKAREKSEFPLFASHLNTLLQLKKETADHIGYEGEPYDALMDEFEPAATSAQLEPLFSELRDATVRLLARIRAARTRPDDTIMTRKYPRAAQEALSRRLAEMLNYDFSAGRADVSTHPFCTTIGGPGDVRITTRYNENLISSSLFGTIHETGHALYEQGLPVEHLYEPVCDSVSLGVHESQSRLWENFIGRSRPFWEGRFAEVQKMFPDALGDVSLDQFWRAVNAVKPSLIRVEADEVTYNLHIILRFEMERGLLNGDIGVEDVPAAWNERMNTILGITPPDDRRGCLQDIHWSMGAFGYFPTYTLGNLYAAQFYEKAQRDVPDLMDRIRAADTRPLLAWLRSNIHRHGRRYRAAELVKEVTGKALSTRPFIQYIETRMNEVYG